MKQRAKTFVVNFINVLKRPDMKVLPGQLAFFFVLSVVPIISLIGFIASNFNVSADFINTFFSSMFSEEIADLLTPSLLNVTMNLEFIVTLVVSFYVASNGANAIIRTSNMIYNIKNDHAIKRRIKAIIMTLIIVLLFIFILFVPVLGDKVLVALTEVGVSSGVLNVVNTIVNVLNIPLSWFVMFLFLKLIYTMAPDRSFPSKYVNTGAIFTSIGWTIATNVYSRYIVGRTAAYSALYGGLTNIAILMLWVYILAIIFVWGMALNYREELAKTGQIEIGDIKKELNFKDKKRET